MYISFDMNHWNALEAFINDRMHVIISIFGFTSGEYKNTVPFTIYSRTTNRNLMPADVHLNASKSLCFSQVKQLDHEPHKYYVYYHSFSSNSLPTSFTS